MRTLNELRHAAERCLADATAGHEDGNIAEDLLRNLAADPSTSPGQIELADDWFNKPRPLLDEFMRRYGEVAEAHDHD